MRSRSTRVVLLLALLVSVAALAGGCGGSKKSSSGSSSGGGATASVSVAATTAPATTATVSVKAGAASDCRSLEQLAVKFSQAIAASGAAGASASGDVKQSAQLFQKFADSVPSSVKPDFEVMAKAFEQYANALAGVHLTPGKIPSKQDIAKLAQAAKSFDAAKVRQAEAHLSAWAKATCPKAAFPSG